ncbi:hypothetical protein [Chitinophaga tropicalis]|uniref:Uncharacterized protein n=1 Tax=Chitinophaga tropicalis TaxID=2683588 RepID=A0A7K1TXZ3_9BACT|nr:hypothetical protein [Chitinophaga tropicalis]MVT06978.1 hypothetical protein [Chitinophaga tropicalis]
MMRKTFDHAGICPGITLYACHTTRTSWGISLVDKEYETIMTTTRELPAIALSG